MSVKRSGGSALGLSARKSTTVSTTEPSNPYEGDVWVNPSAAGRPITFASASMSRSSDQTMTPSGWDKIDWNVVDWDTEGDMADAVTNRRITVPVDGYYLVSGYLDIINQSGNYNEIKVYVNGSAEQWIWRGGHALTTRQYQYSMMFELDADDYVEIWTWLYSSSFEVVGAGSQFQVTLIGAK